MNRITAKFLLGYFNADMTLENEYSPYLDQLGDMSSPYDRRVVADCLYRYSRNIRPDSFKEDKVRPVLIDWAEYAKINERDESILEGMWITKQINIYHKVMNLDTSFIRR